MVREAMTEQQEISMRDPCIGIVADPDAAAYLQMERPTHALRQADSDAAGDKSVVGSIYICIIQIRIPFSISSRTRGVVERGLFNLHFIGVNEFRGVWHASHGMRRSIVGPSIEAKKMIPSTVCVREEHGITQSPV